jgi:hypothetical protein
MNPNKHVTKTAMMKAQVRWTSADTFCLKDTELKSIANKKKTVKRINNDQKIKVSSSMSNYFIDETLPPETLPPDIVQKGEAFFSKHGILIVILLIVIIAIFAIWLVGSKNGDSVTDGKVLPAGFPLYIVRNIFTSISIALVGIGVYFAVRQNEDFNSVILLLLLVVLAGIVMIYESIFEIRGDAGGSALTISLAGACTLFILFLAWPSSSWVRLIIVVPLLWFVFLLLETIAFHRLNKTSIVTV